VNSKPVVIARQPLLRELVLYGFRLIHHRWIQPGGTWGDMVKPGGTRETYEKILTG